MQDQKYIGRISNITEEQARELGFNSEPPTTITGIEDMVMKIWAKIHYEGKTRIVKDDLSNILLILVSHE